MATNGSASASSADLFSTTLISPAVLSALPEGYTCRPLRRTDHGAGFLDVLRVLTTVGDVDERAFQSQFDWMQGREGEYFILVVLDGEGKCVGTGALVVERKL